MGTQGLQGGGTDERELAGVLVGGLGLAAQRDWHADVRRQCRVGITLSRNEL